MKVKYIVFEDLLSKEYITTSNDLPVKIHKDNCRYYVNRDIAAVSVKWHGPFETLKKAEKYAKQIGKSWK